MTARSSKSGQGKVRVPRRPRGAPAEDIEIRIGELHEPLDPIEHGRALADLIEPCCVALLERRIQCSKAAVGPRSPPEVLP